MLDQGRVDLDTPDFTLTLVRSSQTVAALKPKGADEFDFTPGDLLNDRIQGRIRSLGRPRVAAAYRFRRLEELLDCRRPQTRDRDAADLTPTLPSDFPLQITRDWALDGGKLVLRFALKNKTSTRC